MQDMVTDFNPYAVYPEFYENDAIRKLAMNRRWSISDAEKKPLDMFAYKYEGRIDKGASQYDATTMMTLPDLVDTLPIAANHAYWLDSNVDGLCVIDIEKTCPPDLAEKLLRVPALYRELSLSGQGYHLLVPVPQAVLAKYPAAATKTVLKHPEKHFEVLFEHWVTFTRNTIDEPPVCDMDLNDLLEDIASTQVEIDRIDLDIDMDETEAIPDEERIMPMLISSFNNYKKTPADFGNDMSRYEFGVAGHLNVVLNRLIHIFDEEAHLVQQRYVLTDSQKAIALYKALQEVLPARDKHEQMRSGMPWLFSLATSVMEKSAS